MNNNHSLTFSKTIAEKILSELPGNIYWKNQNGEYQWCNNQFSKILKIESHQILGKTDYDFLDKEIADEIYKNDLAVIVSNKEQIIEEIGLNEKSEKAIYLTRKIPIHGLMDEVFINFFKSHIKENEIAEYYLIDPQGSYLMLDAESNLSWFLVRNDVGMEQSIKLAMQYKAPQGVIQALERHEKLLYVPDEALIKNTSVDWNDYLHPIQVLEGQEKYYYSFVKDLKHHNIEQDKILSFEDYLHSAN